MSYPTYDQIYGSRFEPLRGISVDVSLSSGASTRSGFGRDIPGTFAINHLLTNAELAALEADYDANRQSVFTLLWEEDNTTHTVRYDGAPQSRTASNNLQRVSVQLTKVVGGGSILAEDFGVIVLESGDKILTEDS